jgi:hypothetical protein
LRCHKKWLYLKACVKNQEELDLVILEICNDQDVFDGDVVVASFQDLKPLTMSALVTSIAMGMFSKTESRIWKKDARNSRNKMQLPFKDSGIIHCWRHALASADKQLCNRSKHPE